MLKAELDKIHDFQKDKVSLLLVSFMRDWDLVRSQKLPSNPAHDYFIG